MKGFFSIVLAVLVALLVASATSADVTVSATPTCASTYFRADDLGFYPMGINGQGVVCGQRLADRENFTYEAVKWDKSHGLTSLGTFSDGSAGAIDINDRGDVLISVEPKTTQRFYLILHADGSREWIDGFKDDAAVWLSRINNLGQAVGYLAPPNIGSIKGFIWSKQAQVSIEMKNPCWLGDINNHGQAIGYGPNFDAEPGSFESTIPSPIIWSSSGVRDLETIFGAGGVNDINDNGICVGSVNTDPTYQESDAFQPALWDKDGRLFKLKDLGIKGGFASNINNRGEIIGYLGLKPVLWTSAKMKPAFLLALSSGMKILNVFGLNDQGQILAEGERSNGTRGYFLLTPTRR